MNQTKYFCDKCGKEIEKNNSFSVIVAVEIPYSYSYGNYDKKIHYPDLCLDCCSKLGLIKKVIVGDAIKAEPTPKDKLYDAAVTIVEALGLRQEF